MDEKMNKLESILEYVVAILSVFKKDEKMAEERVEKMDIKNRIRAKRAELKTKRLEKKILKAEERLQKYKEKNETGT